MRKPKTDAKIVIEGEYVEESDFFPAGVRLPDGREIYFEHDLLDEPGFTLTLTKRAPTWRAGDVVVVQYGGEFSTPYTYVRGRRGWPGESYPKTDAEISALFVEGKAKPVLQAGGVPFDEGRLG